MTDILDEPVANDELVEHFRNHTFTIFYFGCWQRPGHGFWLPRMQYTGTRDVEARVPWNMGEIDGGLCPPKDKNAGARAGGWPASLEAEQPQGHVRVHRKNGWTALAFWDRTGDSRGQSNSGFYIESPDIPFEEAVALAKYDFPMLFDRFTFELVLT